MYNWVINLSRRWWAVMLLLLLTLLSFNILFGLEDRFEGLTETPVFDTQNNLTPETLLTQLPLYQGEARDAYLAFAAFDFVFPFVSALFLAVLFALLLRSIKWGWADRLLRWRLPLLPFAVTLFDYLENFGLLLILNSASQPSSALLEAALLFKRLKLIGLTVSSVLTITLLTAALIHWLYQRFRSRSRQAVANAS